ncbi:MAG: helix-turn-helix domain-containing protein [Dehalococcoidales bacterium]|nr:helix-turn-helix domain-containing protein [Dehalococcoidales bacterium]
MDKQNQEKLITVREAATQTGKNPETIRRWIWSGKLPAQKIGNQLFIRETSLSPYYAAQIDDTNNGSNTSQTLQEDKAFEEYLASVRLKPEEVNRMVEEWRRKVYGTTKESEQAAKNKFKAEMKKARIFREKLRKRGLVFDTAELIREVREGRP